MRFLFASLALAAIAACHTKSSDPQGPYLISITGKTNSSIKGYARACHASAAEQGLCYEEPSKTPEHDVYYQFFYSEASKDAPGSLQCGHPFSGPDGDVELLSTIEIDHTPSSNVNRVMVSLSQDHLHTNFFASNNDPEGNIYVAGLIDDTHWNQTRPAIFGGSRKAANFHLCWQWIGFYWYHSVAWVSTLPPQNPSCEPVDLKLVGW